MPSMRGPSITCKGLGYNPLVLASSVSTTANSSMPFTNACSMRLSTGRSLQDTFLAPACAAPASCKTQQECKLNIPCCCSRKFNLVTEILVRRYDCVSLISTWVQWMHFLLISQLLKDSSRFKTELEETFFWFFSHISNIAPLAARVG